MARNLNSMPPRCGLVLVLCTLLIYAYSTVFHRQCYQQNYTNSNNNDKHIRIDSNNHHPPNSTVRIMDFVNKQRQEIAFEMKDFEFTKQMVGLSALTPETNGQPLQSGKLIHISNIST